MNDPFISIIIPTYNRPKLLYKTISSVLQQKYRNFEVLIVDDGSDLKINADYLNTDKRLIYHYKKNEGVALARNYGLTVAKGDFIAFLDDDDTYEPMFLQLMMGKLKSNSEYQVAYCKAKSIDIHDNYLNNLFNGGKSGIVFREYLLKKILIYISCCFFNKSVFDTVKGFNTNRNPEDYSFIFDMTRNFKFIFVNEYLVNIRRHDEVNQRSSIDTKSKLISYGMTHITELEKHLCDEELNKIIREAIALWFNYLSFHLLKKRFYEESGFFAKKGIKFYHFRIALYHKLFFSSIGNFGGGWIYNSIRNLFKRITSKTVRAYLHRKFD